MSTPEVYMKQNIGGRVGRGKRPALVLVDFVNGFNDPELLGGGNIPDAIRNSAELLELVRTLRLPVAFTRVVYEASDVNAGAFCRKIPALAALTEENPASEVVPQLAPRADEYVIRKTQASSFFGTNLAAWLIWHRVDTIIVTGCTTSGCVRATVIDSASWNFRTMCRASVWGIAPLDHMRPTCSTWTQNMLTWKRVRALRATSKILARGRYR